MGVIKGQNLRINIGGKFIAFATSCTVHVSANLEESSTKDSTNGWTEQEITGMSWDVSTDALYSADVDQTGLNGEDAMDLILEQQKVKVIFERADGDKNRHPATSGIRYQGMAWVNDISISAQNRQNTTYSLQLQGDGPLEKEDIT